MRDEVETIMAPMGAQFEWRSLDQVTGSEVSSQLAVVKFLGRCQSGRLCVRRPSRRSAGLDPRERRRHSSLQRYRLRRHPPFPSGGPAGVCRQRAARKLMAGRSGACWRTNSITSSPTPCITAPTASAKASTRLLDLLSHDFQFRGAGIRSAPKQQAGHDRGTRSTGTH